MHDDLDQIEIHNSSIFIIHLTKGGRDSTNESKVLADNFGAVHNDC